MAGGDKDYPEHFAAGLKPHAVREKYYFACFQQAVNRIVDISSHVEKKIEGNLVNKAQGPAGDTGAKLKARLAQRKQRLALLEGDDAAASRSYIREFVLAENRELGAKYGLAYAEAFHYIGPPRSPVEEYIRRNARPPG
ncbi:MAG: hypothetical protein FJW37_12205 [Acidobacteria bacterium]|nr:hypothetical protein [Acidobacteriota bacterium]